MRLTNELDVAAPAERTWELLLDLPRLATAIPGATLERDPVGGSYRGTLLRYAGTATLQDVDEDEHALSFYLQGREDGGPGTAAATVATRVQERDGGTRLIVETDLALAGAELERSAAETASALLAELARGLERELGAAREQAAPAADEPIDAGTAAVAIGERVLLVLAGMAAGFAFGRLLGRRR